MTEVQMMEELRQVVSEDDPNLLYSKIKKFDKGELSFFAIFGANFFFLRLSTLLFGLPFSPFVLSQWVNIVSFPVVLDAFTSPERLRQARNLKLRLKRWICLINSLVMKELRHPNIVNFFEFYLVKSNELWVWWYWSIWRVVRCQI